MTRLTVDYGIDLGTTNSSIAVLQGSETKIIENNEGQKYTPSVVWIDKKERLYVGRRARNQMECDSENAFGEFKLQMGTSHTCRFQNGRRAMKPEELSAEIIKSLREDVRQQLGEEIAAAVITVPAAFELPQCEATLRAAQLAGLTASPLLQEPVAAALAYGFQREEKKTFWLVYDMGGGTFDAAIVHANDGNIQVLNHGGDNHLGGKLVDWAIVDRLFAPALQQTYDLDRFDRGNPKWRMAFAKLKLHAEEAKIHLSRYDTTQVFIDPLCQNDRGEWVSFDFELKRADLESILVPYLERSVHICEQVLTESALNAGDIERMILVGGPTQSPLFREFLNERLGVSIEYGVDPLTVVSRGAAVFAGTQRITFSPSQTSKNGHYRLELDYNPIDNDPEPFVAGTITISSQETIDHWTIEFIESKNQWRSGAIEVGGNGVFMTNLRAEKGRVNEFLIELKNQYGTKLSTTPDRIGYTIGATVSSQPLIRSIGVALANNKVCVFLKKGSGLPIRHREIFQTTQNVKKGESGAFLNIPVVEGENWNRADRNHLIGNLIVTGQNVRRDVNAGSEVEVTILIDESRQAHALAYLPILDEEYEQVLKLEKTTVNWDVLEREAQNEKERALLLRKKAHDTAHPPALELWRGIDREQWLSEIDRSLTAARVDGDAADKCQNLILELKNRLDEIELTLEWPLLAGEAYQLLQQAQILTQNKKFAEYRSAFKMLHEEIETHLEARNAHDLQLNVKKLKEFYFQIVSQEPDYWKDYFYYLLDNKEKMDDLQTAGRLFAQGYRAIEEDDIDLLESSVRHLVSLLPRAEQIDVNHFNSTLMPFIQ